MKLTVMVLNEMFHPLLDGLPWNLEHIFMSGCIVSGQNLKFPTVLQHEDEVELNM